MAAAPTEEQDNIMMFTESEDDSIESGDDDIPDNERRLINVFWRTRNWIILQNSAILKMFMKQKESCAIIFTPVSPEDDVTKMDRQTRFVSLEIKLETIIKNLQKGMNLMEGT